MTPDSQLLADFARTNSGDAFAELVRRHINLVYSAALRQVNGDAQSAQDATQKVFTELAGKAASLARRETLAGWLYTSARFAAAKIVRTETRRREREEKYMRDPALDPAPDAEWEQLRPALDDAMHELAESDREAILLRYFENQTFAAVGAKLGLNENAARMRVERALEKLRAAFARRGVAATATLATALSAHAVQLAPTGLAGMITATSLATLGTGTFAFIKIMTATPIKLGISALIAATAATALLVQHQTATKLRLDNEGLTQQLAQLKTDGETFSNRLAAANGSQKLPDDQRGELLKLRSEVAAFRRQAQELETVRKALGNANQQAQIANQKVTGMQAAQLQFNAHEAATINAAKQLGLASRIWSGDNSGQFPTNFVQLTNELGGSFTIGGIDVFGFDLVNLGALSFDHPNMVQFRERMARQMPDGSWKRTYVLVDGSVQTAQSNDGNFEAWEKVNTYSPPPGQ